MRTVYHTSCNVRAYRRLRHLYIGIIRFGLRTRVYRFETHVTSQTATNCVLVRRRIIVNLWNGVRPGVTGTVHTATRIRPLK